MAAPDPQAAVGEPGPLRRRRRGRHPRTARPRRRRADPAGSDRARADGHHGGHQRPARAQGRAHGPRHHEGLRRRAAHRLPEPAADLRPAHRPARAAPRAGDRGRRAPPRPTARCSARSTSTSWPPSCSGLATTGSTPSPSCACTATSTRRTKRRSASSPSRSASRQISLSSEVSPLMKLVPRGDTTVVDAYLSPVLRRYVESVADRAARHPADVHAVQRRAGRGRALPRQGRDPVRARPAGSSAWPGCRSSPASTASSASTWAARRPTSRTSPGSTSGCSTRRSPGVRLRAPMLAIHTVAAGGGSILHFDGSRYRVGPDSAGADPGPACYRGGGPLTVTDANVMLGRIQPGALPRGCSGPTGDQPLDDELVRRRFAELAEDVRGRPGTSALRSRSPRDSCRSRWRTWPTPSSGSRWRRATTSPDTR